MEWITNRVRVFLFGLSVAFLGLINPSRSLRVAHEILTEKAEKKR